MDQEVAWPCSSSTGNSCWPAAATYSSLKYERFVSYNMAVATRSSKAGPIWRQLWRKLKKEKKRMFRQRCCSNSMRSSFTYDPHSYSQNFDDQGSIWADPDHLSRSFSARFAVPSTLIFDKNTSFMV
ncbi:hypothetical protein Salat_1576800 [Sesamum alatum]|uniref:Uncharacterized protein n=1 Tax=Sesamum alatum TaxID=300844 RepID=A0AAE1YDH2_9LAMI|nr:hypothetical protein Salat_1576800 [Sesamum alatum]